jgi:hypothetical protein
VQAFFTPLDGVHREGENLMASNHGVVHLGPGKVEVQSIDYPALKTPQRKRIDHGVIIRPITTNICGSDQHMVRGRTTAPPGLVLGHEITGEVIECGSGVEFISKGDLVSVPFNVACGRRRNCQERRTDVCLNVNPSRAGGAYGYVDLGGWIGGQAANVELISLGQAPEAYQAFDSGIPKKFVIDPHYSVLAEARAPRADHDDHGVRARG